MTARSPLSPASWLESLSETIADLTPDDRAAMGRLDAVRAEYGQDFERELADLRAGRHPLQRPRG